jgi:hypothetical protein
MLKNNTRQAKSHQKLDSRVQETGFLIIISGNVIAPPLVTYKVLILKVKKNC